MSELARPTAAECQPPQADIAGLRRIALGVGLVGAAACAIGGWLQPSQFLHSYLIGYLLWLGVTLGSLVIMMLHHMSRGGWGLVIRRQLEAAVKTLPVMLVLFVPIALGMQQLYSWSRPGATADPLIAHKALYLNRNFFLLRAAIYFAIWMFLGLRIVALSRRQDETADPGLWRRMQIVAGPGIVLYCLTATFASFDWMMSLDPKWFSSIYGLSFIVGQGLSALAFIILFEVWLARRQPMERYLHPWHLHDHGKLMLAFVMVWAYFAFSQFLIIWSGNLPEEAPFYVHRTHGSWEIVSLLVIVLHFALPFVLLLSRDLKRSAKRLAPVAALVLVARWVEFVWQTVPSVHPEGLTLHWLDVVAPIALGGIWLWFFLGNLQQRPLLPVNDPWLPEALAND